MPELLFTHADGHASSVQLSLEPIVVGRDADCEVTIDDPSASRRHVRFAPTSDGYIVEDLGSKNGTLVNDEPCTQRRLDDGDRVMIGSTVAIYIVAPRSTTMGVIIADQEPRTSATRYVSGDRHLLLSQQRLQMIYDLSERLTTLQGRDELLESAMDICFDTLHFERGAIGVKPVNQRILDWPVVRNLRSAEGGLRISRTLLNRALEHGERAIFTEDDAGHADPTVSMVQQGIRSAMCVPLMSTDTILGVVYGDRVSTSASYSEEDIDFLAGIAKQVSIGLINCRLLDEQQEMARLRREMELARTIQTGLFPKTLPNRSELKVAAINDPGDRVSGDYYDVIDVGDGRVWCITADVTGEGVSAALLTANLQAAVRLTIYDGNDPASHLARWNDLIYRNTESTKFITCALALIDIPARRIQVASAGHCRPFLVPGGGQAPTELEVEAGFPLGVVEGAEFQTHSIDFHTGPFVYFSFTDGVIEAMNPTGDQFGTERLVEDLTRVTDLNPRPLVKQIRRAVSQFAQGARQSDDITILAATMAEG